jgi:hypothetical protein
MLTALEAGRATQLAVKTLQTSAMIAFSPSAVRLLCRKASRRCRCARAAHQMAAIAFHNPRPDPQQTAQIRLSRSRFTGSLTISPPSAPWAILSAGAWRSRAAGRLSMSRSIACI